MQCRDYVGNNYKVNIAASLAKVKRFRLLINKYNAFDNHHSEKKTIRWIQTDERLMSQIVLPEPTEITGILQTWRAANNFSTWFNMA